MRRRRLKKLWQRLKELQPQKITRDTLLLKIGAAKWENSPSCRWWMSTCPLPMAAGLFSPVIPNRTRTKNYYSTN
jgi:hypothetical protein